MVVKSKEMIATEIVRVTSSIMIAFSIWKSEITFPTLLVEWLTEETDLW